MPEKKKREKRATTVPKTKKPAKGSREEEDWKKVNREFLAELAIEAKLSTDDTRKFLEGLRKVLLRTVRGEKAQAKIPNVCILRLKTMRATPELERNIFGKMRKVAPRPERKKVFLTATKQFKSASTA